jgi:hypothetical protein
MLTVALNHAWILDFDGPTGDCRDKLACATLTIETGFERDLFVRAIRASPKKRIQRSCDSMASEIKIYSQPL